MKPKEIERAINVSPKEYPQDMPCAVCGYRWMQHIGLLCPAKPGGLMIAAGQPIPVLPVYQTETTFIPDISWQNPNSDFDVV